MNYYCFVDSRDIRKHLEDIQYPLTSPEAAYLVWQCRSANLKEKKQAWEAILTTMPDCSLEGRRDMNAIPSFHQFLRHYLDVLNRQQEALSTLLETACLWRDRKFYRPLRRCGLASHAFSKRDLLHNRLVPAIISSSY